MEIDAVEIGKRIKEIRKRNEISQRELADEICISISQLSNYENGKKTPGLQTLTNICEALNTSIDSIVFGEEESELENPPKTEGEVITSCFAKLFKNNSVYNYCLYSRPESDAEQNYLILYPYDSILFDLYDFLMDFRNNEDTYQNPDQFYKEKMHSIAKRIDKYLNR